MQFNIMLFVYNFALKITTIKALFSVWYVVNDRNGKNGDSAETEASAKSTEASAEASAESLA